MSIATKNLGFVKTAQLLLLGDELAHHGVLGMKWGVRRGRGTPSAVSVRRGGLTGKKLKTSGGEGHAPAKQAVKAAKLGQIKKKSGVAALTNEDLEKYAKRMNLEQQVGNLEYNRKNVGQKFVASLMGRGQKQLADATASQASKQVKKRLAARTAKGVATAGLTAVV